MAISTGYDHVPFRSGEGTLLLGDGQVRVTLHSAALVVDATDTTFTDVTASEISGNGYTAGGQLIGAQTWTQLTAGDSDKAQLDGNSVSWTASGDLTASYAVLSKNNAPNYLISVVDFEGAKTANDGQPFEVAPDPTSGWHRARNA